MEDGPTGDARCHLSMEAIETGYAALDAPRDAGTLRGILCRTEAGARETPDHVELSVDEGVPGDAWNWRSSRKPEMQLAVIRADVAELLGGGQPYSLFGDNLYVELDLSAENLPPGSRLQVGEAEVEVTPEPHDGCLKFRQRFGADALRFVSEKARRSENRRGIYWKVVRSGTARCGDPIRVLSRAAG